MNVVREKVKTSIVLIQPLTADGRGSDQKLCWKGSKIFVADGEFMQGSGSIELQLIKSNQYVNK